jgi:phage terminase large subunit-like protein
MVTRDSAQMYVVSTAGTEQRSPFLWEKVQAGRQAAEAGVTSGIAYLEWSAPPEAEPSDPQAWREAIPAMGVTIDELVVRGDFQGMPWHEFQRSSALQLVIDPARVASAGTVAAEEVVGS